MLLGLHCSPHVCATAGCCVLGRYNGLVVPSMPVFVTTTHKIDAMVEEKKMQAAKRYQPNNKPIMKMSPSPNTQTEVKNNDVF
jgi:hypothetical protein